ncbi:TonB-dependent receptor [Pedobacter sp. BS3]|uniref:TonB-dependent receptor n=1 Tax=Pedobacter sp. BS3 TaxID=2567937 RepID=UPI0011ED2365|nr:TonB-dependent receptor [Pedobacter sp. BS3]TZF83597.1 TonB-dependent receptor [Pedobacter sp. BS3]
MKIYSLILLLMLYRSAVQAQTAQISGTVSDADGKKLEGATVAIPELNLATATDSTGVYQLKKIPYGSWLLQVRYTGYKTYQQEIMIKKQTTRIPDTSLKMQDLSALNEVVITGTMREVSRLESPVPVEVYTPAFFKKNPTPSLFDAVCMINGVKPQLNCNVCNTGDIHINGMEGPYTMILIDGMPIVSALSTVYGLSGIPNSMVERLEVVKGPASSLYGSEAMGGIINVITKNPLKAPALSADVFGTSWGELSADAGMKLKMGKATALLGLNYYNFENRVDNNHDNFTDMTLQNRISLFNKWDFGPKNNRAGSLAARYVYEDRWGGEMNWNKSFRGSDEVYGESIYTKRAEIIGLYQLPVKEKIYVQFSYNWHNQNSWYGNTPYMATQQVAFLQTYWNRKLGTEHNFLLGAAVRYTVYDDNTPATASADGTKNKPSVTPLPGAFIQDEWAIDTKNTLLLGYRYDYDQYHGSVHSPRLAYKLSPNKNNTIRTSFGTGFRVVNLFTEDHAALTGARQVVIAEKLNPERSYNSNLNYVLRIPADKFFLSFDVTGFYSYFTNRITGDFDTDPDKIIYSNLAGHAISKGISLNSDLTFNFPLKILAGITWMDVFQVEHHIKKQQIHAPEWSGTFTISYTLPKNFTLDLTGQWDGPMRLPIQPNDYRPEYSPWFCMANLQITKKFNKGFTIYGGVKNLLNFVPKYPLMRPFDPFDKTANNAVSNPNGYTFDTEYNYASLQGIRSFLGIRYDLF